MQVGAALVAWWIMEMRRTDCCVASVAHTPQVALCHPLSRGLSGSEELCAFGCLASLPSAPSKHVLVSVKDIESCCESCAFVSSKFISAVFLRLFCKFDSGISLRDGAKSESQRES